jgi:hypothetical protein
MRSCCGASKPYQSICCITLDSKELDSNLRKGRSFVVIVWRKMETLVVERRWLLSEMNLDIPDVVLSARQRGRFFTSSDCGDKIDDLSLTLRQTNVDLVAARSIRNRELDEGTYSFDESIDDRVDLPFLLLRELDEGVQDQSE